ncbi:hypothetical protein [Kitasatospora sp. NPDC088783]|uniref:hypothetical protein n=1 Tax=Kitasatospora sp. NPDC088783 TaxID=3364077 RepID=UPI003813849A
MKAPRPARRAATATIAFLLGTGTGTAAAFLIEHPDRAQPAWLGLFAAGVLTAATGTDWSSRRAAPHTPTAPQHQHETHGGRPGQGRTRIRTYRNHRNHR